MDQLRFEVDSNPSKENIQRLGDGLNQHAIQSIGSRGFDSTAIWIRDKEQNMVGGVQALINWNWLHICLIWIDEARRRQGLGSELLNRIERIGLERGCTQAHLDTFSFQARGFYEQLGYEVFGCLEDYPTGQSRYYMRKKLN